MNIYEMSDTFTRHQTPVHLPNPGRPDLPSWVLSPIILMKPPMPQRGVESKS